MKRLALFLSIALFLSAITSPLQAITAAQIQTKLTLFAQEIKEVGKCVIGSPDCDQQKKETIQGVLAIITIITVLTVAGFVAIKREKKRVLDERLLTIVDNEYQADEVQKLIKAGADVNGKDRWRDETVLMKAAQSATPETVAALIGAGANVNAYDYRGETPLMKAAKKGRLDIVKLLVEAGAHTHPVLSGRTAYQYAKREHHEDVAQFLKQFEPKKTTEELNTKLFKTLSKRGASAQKVQKLISEGANVNAQNIIDNTPLMLAVKQGHKDIAEVLIEAGADMNVQDWHKNTPLMQAAEQGNLAIAQLLIEKGANINITDDLGRTAYDLAYQRGHYRIAQLLKPTKSTRLIDEILKPKKSAEAFGFTAQKDVPSEPKKTVELNRTLQKEINAGFPSAEKVKELISQGANVDTVDSLGQTVLMQVVQPATSYHKVSLPVVKELINGGADVNAQNSFTGETVLSKATQYSTPEVVEALIKAGVKVNAATRKGTPLYIAISNDKIDNAIALIDGGATVTNEDFASAQSKYTLKTLDIILNPYPSMEDVKILNQLESLAHLLAHKLANPSVPIIDLSPSYKALGLTQTASIEDIKKAYKQLARQWHTDKNTDPAAKAKFQEISEAYKKLINELDENKGNDFKKETNLD